MFEYDFLYKILLTLTLGFGAWLGLWVYSSNKKNRSNQLFLLLTTFLMTWAFFGFLITVPQVAYQATLWTRIAYLGVLGWLISTYFFLQFFPTQEKRRKVRDIAILSLGVVLVAVVLFTDLLIAGVRINDGIPAPILGRGLIPVYGGILLISIFILERIYTKYQKSSKKEQLQIQYFFAGLLLFIGLNIVFNVFLSPSLGMIPYAYIGNYSALIFLGFTAYAIAKKKLFNIKTALTSVMIIVISILLTVELFVLTENMGMRILKGITWISFLVLSIALFRAMNNEARQKEALSELAQRLEQANRELKKLDQAKSDFLSIASHQLRTPLTAMRGYLSMLVKGDFGPASPKIKEVSKEVYQASLRLLKLSNDLLNVSQIESGKTTLTYEKTLIKELVQSLIDEIKIEADRKNLYLKMITADDLPEVEIDSDKIRQSLLNIIDNALKYTKQGGVTVQIGLSGSNHILIKVKDTGVGLSKEDIGKLFRSFSRGQAGISLHSAGAGLGLYVARKFVDQHKGRLWVESPGRNQGSTFFIELPIKRG